MVSKIKLVKCRFLGETSGGGFDNKKRFLLGCKKSLSHKADTHKEVNEFSGKTGVAKGYAGFSVPAGISGL